MEPDDRVQIWLAEPPRPRLRALTLVGLALATVLMVGGRPLTAIVIVVAEWVERVIGFDVARSEEET